MTPRVFFLKLEGFYDYEREKNNEHWERTRWLATVISNSNPYAKKTIKPRDLIIFPWEEGSNANAHKTPEELKADFKYLEKRWQQI